jgi:hypothetical protein
LGAVPENVPSFSAHGRTRSKKLKLNFPKAAARDRQQRVYSVEKRPFGAEVIFQFYGNAAEKPRETRRTAG